MIAQKKSLLEGLPFCSQVYITLEGTARWTGLLLAHAEGFGRGFLALQAKKNAFYAICAYFMYFLVLSRNLHNV